MAAAGVAIAAPLMRAIWAEWYLLPTYAFGGLLVGWGLLLSRDCRLTGIAVLCSTLLRRADFAKKIKVDVAGLTDAQIEERVKEMVAKGDGMPRALHQSIEPFTLPTVVE